MAKLPVYQMTYGSGQNGDVGLVFSCDEVHSGHAILFTIPLTDSIPDLKSLKLYFERNKIYFPVQFGEQYHELKAEVIFPDLFFTMPDVNVTVRFQLDISPFSYARINKDSVPEFLDFVDKPSSIIIRNYGFLSLIPKEVDKLNEFFLQHKGIFVGLTPSFGRGENFVSADNQQLEYLDELFQSKTHVVTETYSKYIKQIEHVLPATRRVGTVFPNAFVVCSADNTAMEQHVWVAQTGNYKVMVSLDLPDADHSEGLFNLCRYYLNEIVNKRGVVRSADVYQELYISMSNVFDKAGAKSNSSDWLGAAVVTLNSLNSQLDYTGLHSPVVRKKSGIVEELSHGVQRIFYNSYRQAWSNIKSVEKGDCVYIISNNKRAYFEEEKDLSSSIDRLRNLIRTWRSVSIEEQKDMLDQQIQEIKPNAPDDVTVIGIQV